jgi:DNA-binding beta-propeller fold protein YncE
MLALVYLAVAICIGDRICRRFYSFISIPHRWAAAFIVGCLTAGWVTYLIGLMFARALVPLFWGNLFFFALAIAVFTWPQWRHKIIKSPRAETQVLLPAPRAAGSDGVDWLFIALFFALVTWMMFATANSTGGRLQIGNNEYSDFGPNTAIVQSFGVGHNFPTEYPHFSGQRIRYHFLFYFLAGNLEFLGFDPAWSLNLLSILSVVAMLVLVMALGEILFQSRAVARVGAALFFFFGSLSYIPFFSHEKSWQTALHDIFTRREFLPSIFPYRGELWGVWSQVTYANQRHFAMAIGVFFLVLVFLAIRYRAALSDRPASPAAAPDLSLATSGPPAVRAGDWAGFIFSGALLGLLPMWNSAVFIAAAAVLALLFILCPLRRQMVALAIIATIVALPQIIYLSTGAGRHAMPALFHWGYTVEQPTWLNVLKYLGFTFGFKWILLAVALIFATSLQRRFFVAIASLVAIAFLFQLTVEVLANQKFLHIWAIIINLFVAYALWQLWRLRIAGTALPARCAAVILFLLLIPGGIVDLFAFHNSYWSEVTFRNDPLIDWLNKETKPRDIFLTDRFVNHPILMAGRRVFYGWPYYGWSAGYDATERDKVYRELFESKDPAKLFQLLKANDIAYVAYDNAVRHGDFIKRPNEQIYARYFPKVFEDKDGKYNSLTIYKVPDKVPPEIKSAPVVAGTMFEGGLGTGGGQFDSPHGIAADSAGNIFITDTNNGRIEKFSATGTFITSIGSKGAGLGQFGDPNGIRIDKAGNIYVAEASNHRIQKLSADGSYLDEWKGPDPGFYGPRKIAIAPDQSLYVVDQGRTRIVKFDQNFKALAVWGKKGKGDGEFDDPTSVAVDPTTSKVYVADPRNERIQVFDLNGKFLTKWSVPEWRVLYGFEDLVVDSRTGRLYASSANMDSVLVFDLNGNRVGTLSPQSSEKLEGASGLLLADKKLYVLCASGNRVVTIDLK